MKIPSGFSLIAIPALGALMAWLAGCRSGGPSEAPQQVRRVDVPEFAEAVEAGQGVIVDVRTPEEFQAGHIPGARNLNVNSPDFESKIRQLAPGERYLVYCRSGHRSRRACAAMEAAGLTNLLELAPGFNGWQAAGQPVER